VRVILLRTQADTDQGQPFEDYEKFELGDDGRWYDSMGEPHSLTAVAMIIENWAKP